MFLNNIYSKMCMSVFISINSTFFNVKLLENFQQVHLGLCTAVYFKVIFQQAVHCFHVKINTFEKAL